MHFHQHDRPAQLQELNQGKLCFAKQEEGLAGTSIVNENAGWLSSKMAWPTWGNAK